MYSTDQHRQNIGETRDASQRLSEYFRILFRGRWIIVLSFLAVVGATTYLTYRMQPVYQSSASLLIENQDRVETTLLNVEPSPIMKSRNLNAIEVLRSRRIAEDVVRSLANSPYRTELEIMRDVDSEGMPISLDSRVTALRENTKVELLKDTDVLRVTVSAHSAFEAAFLSNALVEQYYRYCLQAARGEISEVRQFLEQQLTTVRDQLSQSEDLERNYKENQSVSDLDVETAHMVKQSADFHAFYNQTETELNAQLRRQDFLKKQLAATKGSLIEVAGGAANPMMESLQREIAQKQTTIASLLANPGPGSEQTVQALEKEIESLKGRLIEEVRKIAGSGLTSVNPLKTSQDLFDQLLACEVEIKSLTAKAEALRDVMVNLDYDLEQLPEKTLVLARLSRDRQLNEKLYVLLNEKYEEARITEAGKSAGVQIVDTALNYHTERLAELSALMTRVDPAQRLEYDICLHTDYLNDQQFESLKRFRAWNILVGMNSINPDTFKALKRRVQPDRFARSVSRLSKEIFRPVVSVLLGLPGDTVEGFRRTLDFCAGLDVHVDINELLVVPETSYFENADQLGLVFDLERSGKVVHGPTLSAEDLKAMAAMADEYVTRHKGDARRWRFMRAYQTDEKLTVPWRLSQHLSRLGIGGAVSSRPFALEGWRLEAVDEDFHPDTLCLNFSRSGEALLRVLLSPANAGQGSFAHTRFFNVSFATDAPGGLTPPGVLRFMERFSHVVKEAEARLPQAG